MYYFLLTHSVLRVIHPIQKLIPNNLVTQNRESAFSLTTLYSLFTYIYILVELALQYFGIYNPLLAFFF